MNPKPEITAANFPALHTFLRGYFHEDVADEYGTPPEAADQFCEDAETRRAHSGRPGMAAPHGTDGRPACRVESALKKLGSAIRLNEEEIPQVSAIFARCLTVKSHRRVANE